MAREARRRSRGPNPPTDLPRMTPREFLNGFRPDRRLLTGGYYEQAPLMVGAADTVGVVLMNGGGPAGAGDVEPFLYNLFMDPAAIPVRIYPWLRDPLSRLVARRRARKVARDYQQ